MITDVEYMKIVNEAYDLSDYNTKKKVLFCNEAQKVTNIEHIVGRLYEYIKSNCTAIDFGTIPKSKGIVTKVDNYIQVNECINTIHDLVHSYHEDTSIVDELSTALANIQNRERLFTKAFALNIEFPIMIYNMTVLSVMSTTSLLISSSIEYIKNGHDSFSTSFDKVGYVKTKNHVLYEYITQFNRNCDNGTIDKICNECIKNNIVVTRESTDIDTMNEGIKDIVGVAADLAAGVGGVANTINLIKGNGSLASKVPGGLKVVFIIVSIGIAAIGILQILRKAIFFILRMMMSISDWFDIQAQFLQINAENLKYRDDSKGDDHKRQVYQRQMKWVDRFKKIANTLAIKDSKARKETEEEERNSKKRTYDDEYATSGGLF